MKDKDIQISEDTPLWIDLGNGLGKWIYLENISYVTEFDDVNKEFKSYHKIVVPKLCPWEVENVKLFKKEFKDESQDK